jgi:membrane protease YdiL (CAAX protease family)
VGTVAVGSVTPGAQPRRLMWWWVLVGVLALLAYSSRATGGRPPEDALYQWGTALSAVIVYAAVLGLVLLIARGGGPLREQFALVSPRSWPLALGLAFAVFVAILLVGAALDPFLDAGEEQGLTPSGWDSDRAAPFAANAIVVVGLAPVIEELTYRGLGFHLLRPYGEAAAIVGVGVAFGLAHGLVEGLLILSLFGMGLAFLRARTGSLYPPILLHAVFNGFALAVSLAV